MKKILFVIFILLFSVNCSADVTTISTPTGTLITPNMSGSYVSSSTAVVFSAGAKAPIGRDTNVASIILSTPSGTAYIGDSSVTMAKGLALAATQMAVTLNISSLSSIYFTGPTNQRLNILTIDY